MNDKKQDSGFNGHEIFGLGALGLGAFWYKYGFAIQVWFHENMVEVVLGGIAILVVSGYVIARRFQKKNQEEIARMRRLAQARPPSQSTDRYYQRPPSNKRRDNHRDVDHE